MGKIFRVKEFYILLSSFVEGYTKNNIREK